MKNPESGQSLFETVFITASLTAGIMSIWLICTGRITDFIDSVLAIVASPIP